MARLGDVCTIVSGTTPSSTVPEYWDGDINWITPAEMADESGVIYESKRKITELAVKKSGLSPFPAGTVLLSSRAPIGKVGIAGVEMYCNQGFKNLICSDAIYNKYLYWFLIYRKEYLNSLGRGATFKEISKSIVETIDIPLPSISEQKKVASLLDTVSELISLRKKQLQKLDDLVKSRFVEMFGDYDLARMRTDWRTISSIGSVVGGATPKTGIEEYWNGEYRWITPAELEDASWYIFDSLRKLTEAGVKSCSLTEMPAGTVMLSSRAPIGKVAIAGNTFYCNQGFKNIICNNEVHPVFLYELLVLNNEYLNSLGRGATFLEISKSIVESIRIPVPPYLEQQRYAEFCAQTHELKSTIRRGLDKLELLKQSLMQKYFG